MKVDDKILFADFATRHSDFVRRCKDMNIEELSIKDIAGMVTYVDSSKIEDNIVNNPYAQELCKRAGNIDAFINAKKNPKLRRAIFDKAAASFGIIFG